MTTTAFSKRLAEAKRDLGFSTRKIRDVARGAGHQISEYTVSQCLSGKHGRVTRNTVEALAYALRIPVGELSELAGLPEKHGHLRLDDQLADNAEALTRPQAEAVREIIRQLAEANRRDGGEHADGSAPIAKAGEDSPAQDENVHHHNFSREEVRRMAANKGFKGEAPGQLHDESP